MAGTERFIQQLESNGARVWQTSEATLANAIEDAIYSVLGCSAAEYINRNNSPLKLVSFLNRDLVLQDISMVQEKPSGQSMLGLSEATLGICETGTLALVSSPENPTSLNFLVDYHLVIVKQKDLVNDLASAMEKLSAQNAWESRAVNFITGPSRTADIEQTIQLGAHGPRHLLVFILD